MRAGICTDKWRNIKIHTNVGWMQRAHVRGIVMGRHVLFSDPAETLPKFLFRHELEHCYQQMRDGVFFFYLKYFYYQVRYGYQKNPYEIEAREMALMPLTNLEQELLWKLNDASPR